MIKVPPKHEKEMLAAGYSTFDELCKKNLQLCWAGFLFAMAANTHKRSLESRDKGPLKGILDQVKRLLQPRLLSIR